MLCVKTRKSRDNENNFPKSIAAEQAHEVSTQNGPVNSRDVLREDDIARISHDLGRSAGAHHGIANAD
jgi:hypothetical protein